MADSVGPWDRFRAATRARIGLGRAGDALPVDALLDFQLAHARARDAVHGAVDFSRLERELAPLPTLRVRSAAGDRSTYLRRPDLGRRLHSDSETLLKNEGWDAVFVVADGLSASAVQDHAAAVVKATVQRLPSLRLGPIVLAEQARVGLGDAVGAAMGAALCAVLVGERPGLSVPNSLGVYLTWAPGPGRKDSERNCISNIHADGLSHRAAADTLAWLMVEAARLKLTGVGLKEEAPRDASLPAP